MASGQGEFMRWLPLFAMLVSCCFAQDIEFSRPSDIKLASGFLKVCGRESNKPSEHNLEAMKNTSPSKFSETFQRVLDAGLADLGMCLAYVEGLAEGWQEGHEHGVVAMQFPGNFPHDLQVALKAVPEKQLNDASLA